MSTFSERRVPLHLLRHHLPLLPPLQATSWPASMALPLTHTHSYLVGSCISAHRRAHRHSQADSPSANPPIQILNHQSAEPETHGYGSSPSPTQTELLTPYPDPWAHQSDLRSHSIPGSTDQITSSETRSQRAGAIIHQGYSGYSGYSGLVHPSPKKWINMDFTHSLENSWRAEDLKGKDKDKAREGEVIWDVEDHTGSLASRAERSQPAGHGGDLTRYAEQGTSRSTGGYRESTAWVTQSGGAGSAAGLNSAVERRVEKVLEGYGRGGRPLPTAIWANVMDTSKGRDKVLVRDLAWAIDRHLRALIFSSRNRCNTP